MYLIRIQRKSCVILLRLGRIPSNGEILQLNSISNEEISEDIYYQVIKQKTAALFEACAGIGAMSANASEPQVEEAKRFGQNLGIIFQIRDDIFDYYDSKEIGKPLVMIWLKETDFACNICFEVYR